MNLMRRLTPLLLLAAATGSWCQPTIDLGLFTKIMKADVIQEMPSQDTADAMLRFEWASAEAENLPTPFIACTEGGYSGVEAMLGTLTSPNEATPLYTEGSLACHVIFEPFSYVQDNIVPIAQFVVPIPAPLKITKGLFDRVSSGTIQESCEDGFIVELSSPLPSDLANWESDIRSGLYIGKGFYWASAPSSEIGTTERQLKWGEAFGDVPGGCASADIEVTSEGPESRIVNIRNVCNMSPPCLLRMLAYVATKRQVINIAAGVKVVLNDMHASGIVQSGAPALRPIWSAGLLGEGQIIQVSDSGLNVNHCWFDDPWGPVPTTTLIETAFNSSKRKLIQYVIGTGGDSIDQGTGHGTHCAGTVAGYDPTKTIGTDNTGAAPQAKLAFYDIGTTGPNNSVLLRTPGDLRNVFKSAYDAGARIFSMSWGTAVTNYLYLDQNADEFSHTYQDALILVAVGNSGWDKTWRKLRRNTVYSPAVGKNIVGVGSTYMGSTRTASENIDGVSSFSGIGPTADGRIKPDVVAPGELTSSADFSTTCGQKSISGTSMATPLVAGHAALIRQYFTEGWYPSGSKTATDAFVPSGALLKAMLVNSATKANFKIQANTGAGATPRLSIGQPPDIYQGFGIVRTARVLRIGNSSTAINLYVQDRKRMQTGDRTVLKFSIPSRQRRFEPFECTLTWTDPPSSTSAALNSINDLDLSATLDSDARNRTLFPNNLSRPDRINNVEKIRIVPTPGDVITVRIRASSVNVNGTQNYAFVASGTFAAAAWYCQDTRETREDDLYRTEHCRRACSVYYKNPVCCTAEAGDTCDPANASPSSCQNIPQPAECIV